MSDDTLGVHLLEDTPSPLAAKKSLNMNGSAGLLQHIIDFDNSLPIQWHQCSEVQHGDCVTHERDHSLAVMPMHIFVS